MNLLTKTLLTLTALTTLYSPSGFTAETPKPDFKSFLKNSKLDPCPRYKVSPECKPNPRVADGYYGFSVENIKTKKTFFRFTGNEVQCISDFTLTAIAKPENKIKCDDLVKKLRQETRKCKGCFQVKDYPSST